MDMDQQQLPTNLDAISWVQGTVAAPLALRAEIALRNEQITQGQLPLRHVFNAPLFTGEQRFPRPEQGREWRVMPLDEDPLFTSPEGFPFPDEVLRRLAQMEQHGFEVDSFYVAHELPLQLVQSTPRTSLALLAPPPPRKTVVASAQMGSLASQLQHLASLPFLGALAVTTVAAVVATGVGALGALDPILFGVVADPTQPFRPGTVAAWYYIAHWVYE